jgi:hypothetical protein
MLSDEIRYANFTGLETSGFKLTTVLATSISQCTLLKICHTPCFHSVTSRRNHLRRMRTSFLSDGGSYAICVTLIRLSILLRSAGYWGTTNRIRCRVVFWYSLWQNSNALRQQETGTVHCLTKIVFVAIHAPCFKPFGSPSGASLSFFWDICSFYGIQ